MFVGQDGKMEGSGVEERDLENGKLKGGEKWRKEKNEVHKLQWNNQNGTCIGN